MNARPVRLSSARRYRRRILGWGAAGVLGLFAIGGPIFVNGVEDDLEQRTVEVLDDAGVGPVVVHFSGQDGELRCAEARPVDIPAGVVAEIEDLWGVESIEIAVSCTQTAAENGQTTDDSEDTATDTAPNTDIDDGATTISGTTPTTTTPPTTIDDAGSGLDLDSLADVVASDSQFSTLAGLLGDAGLVETLSNDGPFSMFAPTDAAFEALGADVIGALARDPELLATVLSHHVTLGTLLVEDMTDGDLEMLDGTSVTLDLTEGVVITSDGASVSATVTESDLIASNGVVHAIDQVMLPADLIVSTVPTAGLTASFVDGQFVLTGQVATEAQQAVLVAAASGAVDPANVVDELIVEPAAAVPDVLIEAFAVVAAGVPPNLVEGNVVVAAEGLAVTGVFASEPDREAFDAVVATIDDATVVTDLVERPAADDAASADLEADLNRLVLADPILFDPSSIRISDDSAATIDRIAAIAGRVGEVEIVIEGHTDTDGLPASNRALSEGRALSVRAALIERGLADDTLTIEGFGGTRPILDVNGVEDKAASRRVEFVVTTAE